MIVIASRPGCSNCATVKAILKKVHIKDLIIVEMHIDKDKDKCRELFEAAKGKGSTLPYVIITKADGTAVAAYSGVKTSREYKSALIKAKKR